MSATTQINWKDYGGDQFARLHGLELFVQPASEDGFFLARVDDDDIEIFKNICDSRESARKAAEEYAEGYVAGQTARARADLAPMYAAHARALELFLAYDGEDTPASNQALAAFTDFAYDNHGNPADVYSYVLGVIHARLLQAERRITDLTDAGNRADDRASMLTKLLTEIDGDLEVLEGHTGGVGVFAQDLRRKIAAAMERAR